MSKNESLIFVEDCKRLRYLKFDGLKFLNNHFEIKNLQTVIFFFFFNTYSYANYSSCFITTS